MEVPKLHKAQREIVDHPARFKVVASGRRIGKTEVAKYLSVRYGAQGFPVAYFAPTYKMLGEVWRAIGNTLAPITQKISGQDKRIELVGGGSFEGWSLDNESARGRKYKLIIVDEAAMVKALYDTWNAVLRPMLTDLKGGALFLSTPRGFDGFHKLFMQGVDPLRPDWKEFQFPSSANPYLPAGEIESAKQDMPERLFEQEYLAAFLDDAGGVFRYVDAVCPASPRTEPEQGHEYTLGVDLARHNDFTVVSVIDATARTMVSMERFREIDWHLQRSRIAAAWKQWHAQAVWVEENSFGGPNIEALQLEGVPVIPFQTTYKSKIGIVDGLAVAMERTGKQDTGGITLLNDPVLVNELKSYEIKRTPAGNYRYEAAGSGHDDTVMATAIAWYGVTGGNPRPSWGTTVI